MMWTWPGSMKNWLQSAPCYKNSCQIIPFCRKEKTPLALAWSEECSQKDIARAYMVSITQWHATHKRAGIYTEDTTRLIYIPTISATCASQHYGRYNKYRKSKNVAPVLSSVEPSFFCPTNDLSATCRNEVVNGDLQTEVLRMMTERGKRKTGTGTVYLHPRMTCKSTINTTRR